MRKKDYEAMLAHPEDVSFTRLFLGLGPKTHRQPKAVAPSPMQLSSQALLSIGGKTYKVVDIKMAPAAATPAAPPAAPAAVPPPAKASPTPAPSSPPAAAVTPAPQPPAAAPEPAAAAPPAAGTEAAVEVPIWTDVQDALLIGLKAINKTWKEIGAQVPGKDTEDLRERYAELTAVKSEEKTAETTNTPETTEDETEKRDGSKKGKNDSKKNKSKAEAGKHEDNDSSQGSGNSKKAKQGKKGKQPKGILKPDDDDDPQDPSDIYQGHPIIFIDRKDDLSPSELLHLSNMHQRLERDKWLQLTSKLFDKTGKRIAPEVLQDRFVRLGLI